MIPTTLAGFQALDLPASEVIAGRIGYPHEAFCCFDYEQRPDLPAGRDVVVLVARRSRRSAMVALAEHGGRAVVVAVPGDAPVRPGNLPDGRLPDNVVALFATNNRLEDARTVSVPLGIRPSRLPAARLVRRTLVGAPRARVVANFTANEEHYRPDRRGAEHLRVTAARRFADADWVTRDVVAVQRTDDQALLAYFAQLARHRFVISPPGNGIDTYRHWEALHLGAVPIVARSDVMTPFSDLPILFTDDYSELTADVLDAHWEVLSRRTFDLEPWLVSTYRRRFLASVGELRDPAFVCFDTGGDWSPRFVRRLGRVPRTGSPAEVESPEPPFVRADSLAEPRAWRARRGLHLAVADDGLLLTSPTGAVASARQHFPVLPGARFLVQATVELRTRRSEAVIAVHVDPTADPIVRTVDSRGPHDVSVEFVALGRQATLDVSIRSRSKEASVALRALNVVALL